MNERLQQLYYAPFDQGIGGAARQESVQDKPYLIPLSHLHKEDRGRVGGKAANLGELTRAGINVPPGFGVTIDVHRVYRDTGDLPMGLVDHIAQVRTALGGRIAIRSSATVEDGDKDSMAGVFTSHYIGEKDDIEGAVRSIYNQANSDEVKAVVEKKGSKPIDMGLVLQKLIDPTISGVIYTGTNGEDLLVQYASGLGEALVDGRTHGSAVIINPKTGDISQSNNFEENPLADEVRIQLINLSKEIVGVFGNTEQDIEFAVAGNEVFIVQSRTHTTELGRVDLETTEQDVLLETRKRFKQVAEEEKQVLGTEKVIFSESNYSELLPNPKEMDLGIFTYIFTGSDGVPGAIQLGRREMGYPISDQLVDYVHYLGGRPYFTISMDAATFYAGFPDSEDEYQASLVREYQEAIERNPEKGLYPEMGLYLQDPTLEDLERRFGDRGEEYYYNYLQFKKRMEDEAETFQETFFTQDLPQIEEFMESANRVPLERLEVSQLNAYITAILEHLRTVACVDFVKAARLGFYYAQRLQQELHKIPGVTPETAELYFARLNQGIDGSAITEANIAIVKASSENAYAVGQEHVGHYSTGEMLEVRHPRLKDDKDALAAYVDGIRSAADYEGTFLKQREERLHTEQEILSLVPEEQRTDVATTISSAQRYMGLRETVKYHFVRGYALARDAMELLNTQLGLPEGYIYHVFPRELSQVVANPQKYIHILRSRVQSFEHYQKLDIPSVVREGDIDKISLKETNGESFIEAKGKFLAEGERIQGTIVNLDILSLEDAESMIKAMKEEGKFVILVAKQLNLGHDPLISLSDGLIIENAGIVSHGAQRAREQGIGALGGISTHGLLTGLTVDFDPIGRRVKRFEEEI